MTSTESEWGDAAWRAFDEIGLVVGAYPPTEDDEEPDPPEED